MRELVTNFSKRNNYILFAAISSLFSTITWLSQTRPASAVMRTSQEIMSQCEVGLANAGVHSISSVKQEIPETDFNVKVFKHLGSNGDITCLEIYKDDGIVGSILIGTGEYSQSTFFEFSDEDIPDSLSLEITYGYLLGEESTHSVTPIPSNINGLRGFLASLNDPAIFTEVQLVATNDS